MAAIKGMAAHLGIQFADMANPEKLGIENISIIAFFGIKQGCKIDKEECDITIDYIEDVIEPHESLHVMRAYTESITGPVNPNAVSSEQK